MKRTVIVLIVLLLVGCGSFDKIGTSITGKPSEVCVDGIAYLQFTSGASVKYTTEGTVALCK